jgi:hypothetical protein
MADFVANPHHVIAPAVEEVVEIEEKPKKSKKEEVEAE